MVVVLCNANTLNSYCPGLICLQLHYVRACMIVHDCTMTGTNILPRLRIWKPINTLFCIISLRLLIFCNTCADGIPTLWASIPATGIRFCNVTYCQNCYLLMRNALANNDCIDYYLRKQTRPLIKIRNLLHAHTGEETTLDDTSLMATRGHFCETRLAYPVFNI